MPDGRRTPHLFERLFRQLLRLYPRSFRLTFETEILLLIRDQMRDAGKQGRWHAVRAGIAIFLDVFAGVLRERSEAMDMRSRGLLGAVLWGWAIAWVDSRPGWDDTGITAGAILLSCLVLAAVSPKQPWQWALAVGVWIPLYGICIAHNGGTVLALLPAFIGAYMGAGLRRMLMPPSQA